MIFYYDLGEDKKLNEIVMAGSHDAGITSGAANIMTQHLDIAGQARAGARVFDLRVTVQVKKDELGEKHAKLKTFHADKKLMLNATRDRQLDDVDRVESVRRTKLRGGEFGMGLSKVLNQAREFVLEHRSEFLILKFDKCLNWELIAEVCVETLGDTIYRGTGNLNTTTLQRLRGKVIVLFTTSGLTEIPAKYKSGGGILGVVNLSGGGGYVDDYDGMQYYGKGGTSVGKAFGKIKQNEKKQGKLMSAGAASDPNVMGMMYWTTTGLNESIKTRNDTMWTKKGVGKLQKLWGAGLSDSIRERLMSNIDPTAFSSGNVLKAFMPNIVMIDFADKAKCKIIYALNEVAATELTGAMKDELVALED